MSFGIPMNPELDPHSNKGDKDDGETNGKKFFLLEILSLALAALPRRDDGSGVQLSDLQILKTI